MKAGWRTARRAGRIALALVAVALAGCSADVASQIGKDAQVRDRVMGAIAGNGDLAEQMMQRLVGTDSLRARVIETVLRDKEGAQYVIGRIGRNSEALDYVLQVAAADSAGRVHLMTLFKGMQMAMQAKK
jgi:hypothetical protein